MVKQNENKEKEAGSDQLKKKKNDQVYLGSAKDRGQIETGGKIWRQNRYGERKNDRSKN